MQTAPVPPPVPTWNMHHSNPPKKRSYGLQREFRLLEREQKVTTLLNSEAFRSELENILRGQLEGTNEPKRTRPQSPGAISPGRSDIGPHKSRHPSSAVTTVVGGGGGGEPIIPINDLRGVDASKYTVAERDQRCKLASVYRLVHMFGWSQLIYNHITACAPGESNTYLVNAFGLLYHEVTASNLVRVSLQGDVLDPGSTCLGINQDGFTLHSAIHEARTDVKCVIHLHTNAGIAVSSMQCGLLPVSSEAAGLGDISYHDFESHRDEDEDYESYEKWREKIAQDLGPKNKVIILRNHGLVAMGGSIEEAFHIAHKLVKACEIQVAVMSAGLTNIFQHSQQGVWSGVGVACMEGVGGACSGSIGSSPRKWRVGDLEFEALMRMLDNKGYNTGYRYKGIGLLEPGTGTPTINKKDTFGSSKRQYKQEMKARQDRWDFLDKRKLVPDEPLTKAKYLKRSNAAKLDKSQDIARSPKVSMEKQLSELPGAQVHDPQESQNLTPLQHVQQTAKHVAQSTGEAVKTLSSKGSQDYPLRKHEVKLKTECFTPMQHAQLTTKEIAHSTGEAVEKPGSKLEDDLWGQTVGAEMKLQSKSNATRHQYSTPKRHVAPDSRKLGSSERTSDSLNITPLQRAELTAQRVAKSTGNSLEKLSASENAVPLHKQNGWLNHESIDLPASGAEKSRYKHSNVPLTPGIDNVSNTVSSESELGNSEYSGKSTSSESERVTLDHCNPADIDYQERFSSFEKVKRTAEMVAESTGEAVQKLSTSFDYSI